MSDPSHSIRRRRARESTGSAMYTVLGFAVLTAPFALLAQAGLSDPGQSALLGLEVFLALVIVVALNGAFVAAETAIDLLRASHLKSFAGDEAVTRSLTDLLENKPQYIATCFLGSQTMRFWVYVVCIVPALAFEPWVAARTGLETGWPSVVVACMAIGIVAIALNVVVELVARTYAVTNPVMTSMRLRRMVGVFAWIFSVPGGLATAIGSLLTRRFGAKASFSTVNQAEEEIKEILVTAEETGEIEGTEKEMLHSVFEFGDTVAREIMTPRVDLDAVPVETPLSEVAILIDESGHSRIPVYEGTDDQIVGIVHAKDILKALVHNGKQELRHIMRPAVHVPENKNLHDLLQELRAARSQMVIVQDEFGGTAGVVTIEDIVEEVVGEIIDEYDPEELPIVQNGIGYVVGGKLNLFDLNDEIGTAFLSEEFDTIGGYVFGLFGRQPAKGEAIEESGYRFTVEDTDGRRILAIRLEPVEEGSVQEGVAVS
ncbi:MAG: HlyC/CorC family transporter [Fimbriimonadaceae bacterium]|nr:HlyC/CorC family transporter [Fimbriimonadaceae bacterium]QYK56194.1 MAG: HlyC/CorC family transporter [Fimbriimonadaceae bacterium]